MLWIPNPTSNATNSACSTLPSVTAENNVAGMMSAMNSMVPPADSAWPASWAPLPGSLGTFRPVPGLIRLPTTNPMPSAIVDMIRK